MDYKDILIKERIYSNYDVSNNFLSIKMPVKVDGELCFFKCPFCRSSYKKNGQPYKSSKPVYHTHGWITNNGPKGGTRTPHCHPRVKELFNLPSYEWVLHDEKCVVRFE